MNPLSDVLGAGAEYIRNWWNAIPAAHAVPNANPAPAEAVGAAQRKANPNVTVEDVDSDDELDTGADSAAEAERAKRAAAAAPEAPPAVNNINEIPAHFDRNVKPLLEEFERNRAAANPRQGTEYERVMKMKLETAILSTRDRIEQVNKNAQIIIREAEKLKEKVRVEDDKLALVRQLRSRLQNESNKNGEVNLANDPLTKQLLQNAIDSGILPAQSIENLTQISREKRDNFMISLKEGGDEVKRVRDGISEEIQKKSKEAYKLVETYNECWKMLKKLIDEYYAILKKMAQALRG